MKITTTDLAGVFGTVDVNALEVPPVHDDDEAVRCAMEYDHTVRLFGAMFPDVYAINLVVSPAKVTEFLILTPAVLDFDKFVAAVELVRDTTWVVTTFSHKTPRHTPPLSTQASDVMVEYASGERMRIPETRVYVVAYDLGSDHPVLRTKVPGATDLVWVAPPIVKLAHTTKQFARVLNAVRDDRPVSRWFRVTNYYL